MVMEQDLSFLKGYFGDTKILNSSMASLTSLAAKNIFILA
jgi:hypothetical protein